MKSRKMKKMFCLLLAAGLAVSVAGCGDRGKDGSQDGSSKVTPDETRKPDDTKKPDDTEEKDPTEEKTDPGDVAVKMLHPVITECSIQGLDSDSQVLMWERYAQLKLNEEEGKQWAELSASLEEDNRKAEEEAEENFRTYYEEAEKFFKDNDAYGEMYFSDETEASAVRADSAVFSVLYDFWTYTGGAHGSFAKKGVNYDTKSGEKLKVSDVITDMDKLTEILSERLMESYGEVLTKETVENHLKECRSDETMFCWLMDYEGVTFIFNSGMLTSPAAGKQSVWIGFDEYPELFAEKYTAVPEAYVMPVFRDEARYTDVTGDGKPDRIQVEAVPDEYGSAQNFAITVNEKTETQEIYAYSISSYIVHMENGTFLYAFCTSDNDYEFLQVYSLCGGAAIRVTEGIDVGAAHLGYSVDNDEAANIYRNCGTTEVFADPADFNLSTRIDVVSTISGRKNYHVDENGLPKSDMSYYDVSGTWQNKDNPTGYQFTTLAELKVAVIGEDMCATGDTVTVPVGTKFSYLRTDNESWADFLMEDGTIVRAAVTDEYPQQFCDMDLEKALEGTVFAG